MTKHKERVQHLEERFNMKLLVMPLMVRVFSLIHAVILSIGTLVAKLKIPTVPHFQMALRAKQDAVTEGIRAAIFSWFPVMRLPAPALALGAIAPKKRLTTSTTSPPLPVPSLLYSIARKGQHGTSHFEVSSPRVKNGWIWNEDMWVLIRDSKSYNIAVMYTPPWEGRKGGYAIFRGSKVIGFSRTLEAAKRRAEKIGTPKQPFK